MSVLVGNCRGGGPGDRVVTAQDDRHDAPRGDLAHSLLDVRVAGFGVAVRTMGVAVVDDFELVEDLDVEVHVVGAGLIRK